LKKEENDQMGSYFSAPDGYKPDEFVMRVFWVCGSAKVIGIVTGAVLLMYLKYQVCSSINGCQSFLSCVAPPPS
jgi:hypothetical protein